MRLNTDTLQTPQNQCRLQGTGYARPPWTLGAVKSVRQLRAPVRILMAVCVASAVLACQAEKRVESTSSQAGNPMTATILTSGRMVKATFSEAVLHLSGEFGGNLDFSVTFVPGVPTKEVLQNLWVRMPGRQRMVDVAGYQKIPGGLEVTVYSELRPPGQAIPVSEAPTSADVFWLGYSKEQPITTLKITVVP